MSDNFNKSQMAKLFRETADLIDQGVISEINIHMRQGIERERIFDNGQRTTQKASGERVVSITLRGHCFSDAQWNSLRYESVEPPKLDAAAMRGMQDAQERARVPMKDTISVGSRSHLAVINPGPELPKHPNQANCEDCED